MISGITDKMTDPIICKVCKEPFTRISKTIYDKDVCGYNCQQVLVKQREDAKLERRGGINI